MNSKDRIDYLIGQCLQQRETEDERTELLGYITDSSNHDQSEAALLQAFYQDKSTEQLPINAKNQMLEAIFTSTAKARTPRVGRMWRWASVAAAALMVIIPLFMQQRRESDPRYALPPTNEEQPAQERPLPLETIADVDAATLEMVDGTKIFLPSLAVGSKILKNGLIVHKTAQDELLLSYDIQTLSRQLKNANHVIKTPKGGSYHLTLPDGSKVRLNSASKLVLPYSFNDSTRYVKLSGEAYFEVVKDPRRFIVYSRQANTEQEVRVYGTSFNISAYPDDNRVETTLVEGSVRVANLDDSQVVPLEPNEQLVLEGHAMKKYSANLAKTLAWLNNVFYFEEEPLEDVLREVSRWYDVEFTEIPNLPNRKIWAQVSREIELTDLLQIIEKTHAIKFKIVGKEVHIVD